MTDTVRDRLLHGATVLRARAARIARAYSPDMSIRDGDADALASFAEAVVEALAASPQEAAPTKREAALADLAKLDGETMDLEHDRIKRAIADGFSNGCEQYDEASEMQRLRYDMAAQAVFSSSSSAMSADHIGEATNMIAPVAALSSKPVDDRAEANSSVKPTVEAVTYLWGCADGNGIDPRFVFRDRDDAANIAAGLGLTIQPLYAHPPQPDAQGWQDIATAPRDGDDLLVSDDETGARHVSYWTGQCWSGPNGFKPTHWMPLPPPPSARPAPIKPSGDTGELRVLESGWTVGQLVSQLKQEAEREGLPVGTVNRLKLAADAILDLIQSERVSSPISQNDQPGLAFSGAGEP